MYPSRTRGVLSVFQTDDDFFPCRAAEAALLTDRQYAINSAQEL
jgi:hypothetical protein